MRFLKTFHGVTYETEEVHRILRKIIFWRVFQIVCVYVDAEFEMFVASV
jgi:hypothetical protein